MRIRGRVSYLVLAALTIAIVSAAGTFFVLRNGHLEARQILPFYYEAPSATARSASPGPDVNAGGQDQADSVPAASPEAATVKTNPRLQSSLAELSATEAKAGSGAAELFAAERGLEVSGGKVRVVLEAAGSAKDTADTVATVSAQGGSVETTHGLLVQARVPVGALDDLSKDPAVSYIRTPRKPVTFTTTSEGVADIEATVWHDAGSNGAGAKIAVLDPGFLNYSQRISEGELPANVITRSFRSDGDITGGGERHGTACAEIVYDVAPGAQIYLVNFSTDVELANAVDYLVLEGVDVVSASWGFFGSFRGDGQGPINDLVQQANAGGILWANASGNSAQTHWSGAFTDSDLDNRHEFAPADSGNDLMATYTANERIDVYLTWNDWPYSDQDYDLYLVWEGQPGSFAAVSWGPQTGTQEPAEEIHYIVPPGRGGRYWIEIENYDGWASGDADFKLYTYPDSLEYQVAAGSLGGQPSDSPYAMTVGAVPAGGTIIEYFSSQGPTVDGRTKPDLVAPDRVSTVTYGPQSFWGTSAATPHAAAAGALMIGSNPSLTPSAVQSMLQLRATDLGLPGSDNVYGSGKLNLGSPDTIPPQVTAVIPAGMVDTTSAGVTAYYNDSLSGIAASSVSVTLDGAPIPGCTITAESASCPVSGLASGVHNIGGTVSDNAGNAAGISGSFIVTCGRPELTSGEPQSFWASYADYLASELSVSWTICNESPFPAISAALVGSVNTNSVISVSALPQQLGDIQELSCTTFTMRYLVPSGISVFRSLTYATASDRCGTGYAYPAPYPEP